MTYNLKKLLLNVDWLDKKEVPKLGIDLWVDAKTKTVDRGINGEILLGSFFMTNDGCPEFYQPEEYQFDLEDIKLIARVSEQIEINGFDKMYEESI